MNSQSMTSKAHYRCAAANRNVHVHIKRNSRSSRLALQSCTGIGECQCGVVKIVCGMTYEVDWKRCSFCSETERQ